MSTGWLVLLMLFFAFHAGAGAGAILNERLGQ